MEIPRILSVDDEEEARTNLSAYLMRNLKCEISEAGDGSQAIEKIEKETFDLILLDIKMPGISGLDVLEKAKSVSSDCVVLIVSGYDSEQVAREALKKGADDYIIKPSTREAILQKVVEVLKKKNKYIPKSSS